MNELESLELKISTFLRIGVIMAGLFMFTGWIVHLVMQGPSLEALRSYHAITLDETLRSAITSRAWSEIIAYLGLIILIALPLIRVFLTAFLFIKQKEYLLASIASVVLIALVISFSLGIEL